MYNGVYYVHIVLQPGVYVYDVLQEAVVLVAPDKIEYQIWNIFTEKIERRTRLRLYVQSTEVSEIPPFYPKPRKIQAFPPNFLVRKLFVKGQKLSVYGIYHHKEIRWKNLYLRGAKLLIRKLRSKTTPRHLHYFIELQLK